VDSVRLPKQAYFVYRVMQNSQPDIHIIGHWSYPDNTKKTVYVAANHCDTVELFLNGQSLGTAKPVTGYIYAFPNVTFAPGTLKAVAYQNGQPVCQEELQTAGAPKSLKLVVHTGPKGLQADGADVALIDFKVVDAQGNLCPTDEARVDFQVQGPAIWRGGYNSGILHSTNNLYLLTEDGINRVAVRSTLTPGTITVTATRAGLDPASVQIESHPVAITDGLSPAMPPVYPGPGAPPVADLVPSSPTADAPVEMPHSP
jgi:beta-galactosidase